MARKGVLVSSAEMREMTPVRWLYEYVSLREKEFEDWRKLRKLLINVMGLDMVSKSRFKNAEDPDIDKFAPLVMFLNPVLGDQMIEEYMQDIRVESEWDEGLEKKLDDPDSLITELQVIEKPGAQRVVEEDAAGSSFGFTPPPASPKVKIDK